MAADLTMPAPSPMSRALDLAIRLVAQAQAEGIEIHTVNLNAECGTVSIHARRDDLAAALAAACGLTERSEFPIADGRRGEWFQADIDGMTVYTWGPIPEPAAAEPTFPTGIVAGWVCPCGARGWLMPDASDEDRVAYDESAAEHFGCPAELADGGPAAVSA